MGGTVKLCLAVDKIEKFHPWPERPLYYSHVGWAMPTLIKTERFHKPVGLETRIAAGGGRQAGTRGPLPRYTPTLSGSNNQTIRFQQCIIQPLRGCLIFVTIIHGFWSLRSRHPRLLLLLSLRDNISPAETTHNLLPCRRTIKPPLRCPFRAKKII